MRFAPTLLQESRKSARKRRKEIRRGRGSFTGVSILERNLTRLGVDSEVTELVLCRAVEVCNRRRLIREQELANELCTVEELFAAKSLLQGLVVSNIDKNKG